MMKTKIKKVLALLTLSLGILAVAPSDAKAETAVVGTIIVNGVDTPNTVECQKFVPRYYEVGANGTLKSRSELYATRQDMIKTILARSGSFFTEEMISNQDDASLMNSFLSLTSLDFSGFKFVGIENLNGVQVYHFSKNLDVSASQFKPEEMTAHTFKISEWNASWLANIYAGDKIRFKMPFKVAKTNGVLLEDGQTVEFTSTLDDDSNPQFDGMFLWAADEQASQATDITFVNIKDGGCYNFESSNSIKVQSSGLIISKELSLKDPITNKFKDWNFYCDKNAYPLQDANFKCRVTLASGATKTISVTTDSTKPEIDINKYFSSSIEVVDENIKSVTFDGKKLKRTLKDGFRNVYKTKLKRGDHNVVALDKAGNILIKKFKISSSGKAQNIKTVKDKTKPSTNVRAKSYKKSVKITFSDYYGVAKATLNDKVIKNNHKVSKKGSYTLKIWDYAGNCKTVKFKIKK